MVDPQTLRINDAADPDRLEKFEAALLRTGQRFPDVMRRCAEAYIRYVDEHGNAPTIPFDIVPHAAKKK